MTSCTCGNHRERMGEHRDTCPAHRKNRPGLLKRMWNNRPDDEFYTIAALIIIVLSAAATFAGIAARIVRWGFGI